MRQPERRASGWSANLANVDADLRRPGRRPPRHRRARRLPGDRRRPVARAVAWMADEPGPVAGRIVAVIVDRRHRDSAESRPLAAAADPLGVGDRRRGPHLGRSPAASPWTGSFHITDPVEYDGVVLAGGAATRPSIARSFVAGGLPAPQDHRRLGHSHAWCSDGLGIIEESPGVGDRPPAATTTWRCIRRSASWHRHWGRVLVHRFESARTSRTTSRAVVWWSRLQLLTRSPSSPPIKCDRSGSRTRRRERLDAAEHHCAVRHLHQLLVPRAAASTAGPHRRLLPVSQPRWPWSVRCRPARGRSTGCWAISGRSPSQER